MKSLFKNRGLKKYSVNTSWVLIEKGIRILASIIGNALVARYLGAEKFGILAYALSLLSLLLSLVTLSMDEPTITALLGKKINSKKILGSVFFLRLVGALAGCLIVWTWYYFSGEGQDSKSVIQIISLSLFFQSFGTIDLYFQSQVASRHVFLPTLVQQWLSISIKIILIALGASLNWFAWVYVFDGFMLAVGLIFIFHRKGNNIFEWGFNFSFIKDLLLNFWPLAIAGMATSIYMRIDQIMIKELLNMESVGLYATTLNLTEVWYILPMVVCQSLFPAIVNAKEQNSILYYRRLQTLMDGLAGLAVLICILFTFFGSDLVYLIYGKDYMEAVSALQIIIWSTVFVFLGNVTSRWFVIENIASKSLVRILIGIAVKTILNLLLIPILNINGAAISTLTAHITASLFYDLFDKDCRHMFSMKLKALSLYGFIKIIRNPAKELS